MREDLICMNIEHKKIAAVCILTAFLILVFTFPVHQQVSAKNNIALECNIVSFCCESSDGAAAMLVDRDVKLETKWHTANGSSHSGEPQPHWIVLDFETEKTFDSVRLIKASQGAGDFGRTEFNASGFIFEISSDLLNWVKIIEETDDGDRDIFDRSFLPASARYLKLTVTQPEQNGNNGENHAVRLYDLKVFEYIAIPENDKDDEIQSAGEDPAVITAIPPTSDSVFFLLLCLLSCVILFPMLKSLFLSSRS